MIRLANFKYTILSYSVFFFIKLFVKFKPLILLGLLWKSSGGPSGIRTVRATATSSQPHRVYTEHFQRGLAGNPPHLSSSHLRNIRNSCTHSLIKYLHSKTMWAQTDTFSPPQEQTLTWTWRDSGAEWLSRLLTSHFTAALHNLFVFEKDTPPSRQKAPLIKFLKPLLLHSLSFEWEADCCLNIRHRHKHGYRPKDRRNGMQW